MRVDREVFYRDLGAVVVALGKAGLVVAASCYGLAWIVELVR